MKLPLPSATALALVPREVMRKHNLVPLAVQDNTLSVALKQLPGSALLRELSFLTGCQIEPIQVEADQLQALLKTHAGLTDQDDSQEMAGASVQNQMAKISPTGSVVQQVDHIIRQAIERRASDIHIEPYEYSFRVRFRLDGVLHLAGELALLQKNALISRLKVMAGLDIAEKRRPQDGRIRFQFGEKTIDLRVSTLPTDFGEKVVLRILDKSHLKLSLEALGFSGSDLRRLRRAIHLPYGMMLVTGPTGSGKTTTLYAALSELNSEQVNITTIEDPIEYNLHGINQTHVRADIGFTFAKALRSFLRQDPNIIMVGEVRDHETASIAIRAALTGHMVLSTIHTNDAPSTISRLIDMGVEPFLVASSIRLVVAQRLVRKICTHCKTEVSPDPSLLAELELSTPSAPLYQGTGCAPCNHTGYQGRTALFELMPMSEQMATCIAARATLQEIRAQARREGNRSLRTIAIEKAMAGITTLEEVIRETVS